MILIIPGTSSQSEHDLKIMFRLRWDEVAVSSEFNAQFIPCACVTLTGHWSINNARFWHAHEIIWVIIARGEYDFPTSPVEDPRRSMSLSYTRGIKFSVHK